MRKTKFIVAALAILLSAVAIYFALSSERSLVLHPEGIIAKKQLDLIVVNTILMLLIIIPTFILLLAVAWKYRSNGKAKYEPKHSYGVFKEIALWGVPSVFVAVMAVITWKATHALDPYKPIESSVKQLTIQVVALDWKWLFIYPEEGIATVNFVQFPERTPIRFELTADTSPMNSFWIPQLSGQIYCMTGMVTPLHIMADGPGTYSGKAAEINGEGYAKMTFVAKSTSQSDFEEWVLSVKKSPLELNEPTYEALIKSSIDHPVELFSNIKKDLFNHIVMKFMHPSEKNHEH